MRDRRFMAARNVFDVIRKRIERYIYTTILGGEPSLLKIYMSHKLYHLRNYARDGCAATSSHCSLRSTGHFFLSLFFNIRYFDGE